MTTTPPAAPPRPPRTPRTPRPPRPPRPHVRQTQREPARGQLRGPAPGPARRLLGRLTHADRQVLRLYLLTRLGLLIVTYCTGWLFPADSDAKSPGPWLSHWERWDWGHYRHIAEYGYFGAFPGVDPASDTRAAFFPGFPLALRAVHTVVPSWTVAGLLISLVCGAVAVVALARIAGLGRPDGDGRAGKRAVGFLLLSPAAVFLAAGYTESLFLACALPAWLAAKNRHWPLAGLLTAAATTTRVSGLFLAAAIAVEFLAARNDRGAVRHWRSVLWCALPAGPALAFTSYLHEQTGDWMAWKHAQERGWARDFHTPAESFRTTWHNAFDHLQSTGYAWEFQLELAAMATGVVLLAWLLVRRRWPEAVYIALTLWALGTSYWYLSIPRATLLWWPLWTGLAHWSLRRGWVKEAYVFVVAPLTVVLAMTFASGRWAG